MCLRLFEGFVKGLYPFLLKALFKENDKKI